MPLLGDPMAADVIDYTEKWAHVVLHVGHNDLHKFFPITNLFDQHGHATTDWKRARCAVAGEGETWVNFDVDVPPHAVH